MIGSAKDYRHKRRLLKGANQCAVLGMSLIFIINIINKIMINWFI